MRFYVARLRTRANGAFSKTFPSRQSTGISPLSHSRPARPAAFCFGIRKSYVVITQGLLDRLDADEQAAAVWHEAHHARVREPLKCLAARLAAQTFFWLPVLDDLLDRYLLVKELEADRFAAQRTSRRALAGALHEVIGASTPAGAVGLADRAASRVDRLFDDRAPLPPLTRPLHVLVTGVVAAALVFAVLVPTQLDVGESEHLHAIAHQHVDSRTAGDGSRIRGQRAGSHLHGA